MAPSPQRRWLDSTCVPILYFHPSRVLTFPDAPPPRPALDWLCSSPFSHQPAAPKSLQDLGDVG